MKRIYIHPTAEVSENAKIGEGTKIWNQAQVREDAHIDSNCNIGKNVYIDKNVVLGNHVKVQNNVNIYDGVEVEDDVFLGPSMTFTNDRFPRAFTGDFMLGRTIVKKGASIGANATIRCDTVIGEYSMIASGSVVTKDVAPYSLVAGNPARQIGWVCRCGRKVSENLVCESCGFQVPVTFGG